MGASPHFSALAWDAVRLCLKTLRWSVGTRNPRGSARRGRQKASSDCNFQGDQKEGRRRVLNRASREDGEEQIQGAEFYK